LQHADGEIVHPYRADAARPRHCARRCPNAPWLPRPNGAHHIMANGSCLCGRVRFRLDGPFHAMMHCHCSRCRKHHGSAFATFVAAPSNGFEWTAGRADIVTWLPTTPGAGPRHFCPTCGSVAPAPDDPGEVRFVPAGNLTDDCGVTPEAHIYAASKAAWYQITDRVPQFAALPDGYPDPNLPADVRAHAPGKIAGSCLCDAVRYEVDGPPLTMVNCHCSRCRRGRSAAHASNLFVGIDHLRFTRGHEHVHVFDLPAAERFGVNFCEICGSDVPRSSPKIGRVNIPGGSLDTDPGIRPSYHIYVGSKAPWYEITDTLPRYETVAQP
jgi:hypothetical protein